MSSDRLQQYAHSEVLVTTDWVEENLDQLESPDPDYRVVEVDVDPSNYQEAHIPGAVGWDWGTDLCDSVTRDLSPRDEFEELLESSGIDENTTVILYGDSHNWFAAWAFWQLKYYRHEDVRLIDGGRDLWLAEDRPTTQSEPSVISTSYDLPDPDEGLRAYQPDVREHIAGTANLVDVRSPEEFSGEKIAPEGVDEGAQRGGHIPGASNIPWASAVDEDGRFKPLDELKEIYGDIDQDIETIAYCRIGERSSHSWFVVKYLLGIENVKNYDGSWTEWGNAVGVPIETGS